LTEPNFCKRLRDLQRHEGLSGERALRLLCYGRHFRLDPRTKLIVGRHEKDNDFLQGNAELYDLVLRVDGVPGPTALLPLTASEAQVQTAAGICARYSDAPRDGDVRVRVRSARAVRTLCVRALDEAVLESYRI
jgi:predicted ribosome quality control (RQC) complex YloA/Tae2 family protein